MTKDDILACLWRNADLYVSGEDLAHQLSISRTAVWKAIQQLKSDGYEIESVSNRGYRLRSISDVLSLEGISRHLKHRDLTINVYKRITSTNTVLKSLASEGAADGLVLVSEEQTAGRGRMGRNFYSPSSSGLYLSLLLRPAMHAADATRLTACAAVAVAEAIEELSARKVQIKWVNDIYMDGHKVCGILTEASIDCETGLMNYVIIGIGVNIHVPAGNFPEDIRNIAGAAFDSLLIPELRCRLTAGILDRLRDYTSSPNSQAVYDSYKHRSLVLGKDIRILSPGREPCFGHVEDLEKDYSLLVRLPDGTTTHLNSGEVSIRL